MGLFSSLAGPVLSFAGGLLSGSKQEDIAADNIALQRQFAQNAIQWKVKDAQKAGIHPLYALGAPSMSFSPVSVGSDPGTALQGFGNAISDAMLQKEVEEKKSIYKNVDYEWMVKNEQLKSLELQNKQMQQDLFNSKMEHDIKMNKLLEGEEGRSPKNPLPLLQYYRDPLSGEVFVLPHPDIGESAENFAGKGLMMYGNTRYKGKDWYKKFNQ